MNGHRPEMLPEIADFEWKHDGQMDGQTILEIVVFQFI